MLYLQVAAYLMLPLSFGSWPYAFYQALRWVVAGAFLSMVPRVKPTWATAAICAAVVFNPIAPFHFEKSTWQIIDFAAFILLCFIGSKQDSQGPKTSGNS